jgi:sugar-specific transcriptional regulator TrmB
MLEKLKNQEEEKNELQEKINRLSKLILVSSSIEPSHMFSSMMRRKHKSGGSSVDLLVKDSPDLNLDDLDTEISLDSDSDIEDPDHSLDSFMFSDTPSLQLDGVREK